MTAMNRVFWICLLLTVVSEATIRGGDKPGKGTAPAATSEADLAALRARAANERPAFEAFGWKVYRWESQCYGVYFAKRSPEFIASAVKKTDTEIQISGPGEIILDSKKEDRGNGQGDGQTAERSLRNLGRPHPCRGGGSLTRVVRIRRSPDIVHPLS